MQAAADKVFAGSIPGLYERYMVPMLFQPYAADMAARAARLKPADILETAAGTGVATLALRQAMPHARIKATDLNPDMIRIAAQKAGANDIGWQAVDATALPFEDGCFDLVVCQFGVMFFPDKLVAFREARRVLRPGGTFLFTVWDDLAHNPVTATVMDGLTTLYPENPPSFMRRLPHGFSNVGALLDTLCAAGFASAQSEKVELVSRAEDAAAAATGLCQGSPMRSEIEARDPGGLDRATAAARAALVAKYGAGPIADSMQAIVVAAHK